MAWLAATVVVGISGMSAAVASTYPPQGPGGTEVFGGKNGPDVQGGATPGGLAETGGSLTLLWVGLALLVTGALILALVRRRHQPTV
jgi:LPXTG-motif cell wall-anchored protein